MRPFFAFYCPLVFTEKNPANPWRHCCGTLTGRWRHRCREGATAVKIVFQAHVSHVFLLGSLSLSDYDLVNLRRFSSRRGTLHTSQCQLFMIIEKHLYFAYRIGGSELPRTRSPPTKAKPKPSASAKTKPEAKVPRFAFWPTNETVSRHITWRWYACNLCYTRYVNLHYTDIFCASRNFVK